MMNNRWNRKRVTCLLLGHELWSNRSGGSFCMRCLDVRKLPSIQSCHDPLARAEAYELFLTYRALSEEIDQATPPAFADAYEAFVELYETRDAEGSSI